MLSIRSSKSRVMDWLFSYIYRDLSENELAVIPEIYFIRLLFSILVHYLWFWPCHKYNTIVVTILLCMETSILNWCNLITIDTITSFMCMDWMSEFSKHFPPEKLSITLLIFWYFEKHVPKCALKGNIYWYLF